MREAGLTRVPDGLSAGLVPSAAAKAKALGPKTGRRKAVGRKEAEPEVDRADAGSPGRVRLAAFALDHLPLAVGVLDRRLRLHYWNRHAAKLFGMPAVMQAELPRLANVLRAAGHDTPRQIDRIVEFCGNMIARADRVEPDAWLRVSLSGRRRVALKLHDLGRGRWLLSIEDLIPASMIGQPGGDAMLDALTGLSNRRGYNIALRDLVEGDAPCGQPAVMIIDLDGFKTINDTLGRSVGDAALCLVAKRLRRAVREEDVVARLGGDEFAILQTDGQQAESLATRVVDVLSRPFLTEGQLLTLGASVGIARFPEHGATAGDLLRHADLSLYDAKSAGRGTWRIFDPLLAEQARDRRELEIDLRRALTLGESTLAASTLGASTLRELSLVYHPQLDAPTRRVIGFEALPRWTHPVRGAVAPVDFMPVAEAAGCATDLAEWMLKTACQEAVGWRSDLSLVVKVSPQQLADGDRLLDAVRSALTASGLPPNRLDLQITESGILRQEAGVLTVLQTLRAMGVQIVMDDFGTRYPSLGQLPAGPFDRIKIDQALVATLGDAGGAGAAIHVIVALDVGLGRTLVTGCSDAVERPADRAADEGSPTGVPMPAAGIEAWLMHYSAAPART